jgi:hypothetical protein
MSRAEGRKVEGMEWGAGFPQAVLGNSQEIIYRVRRGSRVRRSARGPRSALGEGLPTPPKPPTEGLPG